MIATGSIFYLVIVGIAVMLRLLQQRAPSRKSSARPPLEIPALPEREETTSAEWQPMIQAYLAEYETLREEQLKRVEFASQVQIYGVLLLGAMVPLVEYVDYLRSSGGDGYILFLLAALVFCALGWYQIELDDKFAELDNYLLLVLKPNLQRALEGCYSKKANVDKILDWHLYWRRNRYRSIGGIWLSLGVIGRAGVSVLGASALLGSYIYFEHVAAGAPWHFSRILLVGLVGSAIIWMLISGTMVRNKLANGIRAYESGIDHV